MVNIPIDLIESIGVSENNAAASRYAHEKLNSFEPEMPAEFRGPPDLRIGTRRGSWMARAVCAEIRRLKKEFVSGSHAAL